MDLHPRPDRPFRERCREHVARTWFRLVAIADVAAQRIVRWPAAMVWHLQVRSANAGMALCGPIGRWLTTRLYLRRGLWLLGYWWATRRLRFVLRGLPALLALAGAAVVALLAARYSADQWTLRYKQEAQLAWHQGEVGRAKLCLERLALSNPGEPAY